jgi:glucokinase-like ROK family protein
MVPTNTVDQGTLREMNLSAVLRFIYHEAPLSRSQLAGKTGLNKSTISSLVEDLLERKLVHETGVNSAGKGRPATLLEINPKAGVVIAIELGVDFVGAAVIDFKGNIGWRKLEVADPAASQEKTLGQTKTLVEETVEICRQQGRRVFGLSFSIPGTVDLDEGLLIFAPNLNWRNVPLREIFSALTGLNVFIENDANAAAVAEHLFGVARNLHDFLFVFAGVGLGGGLFLNDKLYRGKGGYAGEIGHTPIIAEPFQNPCHCGNLGCWETYANQFSILQRVETRLGRSSEQSVIPLLMAQQNSPLSIAIIKEAAEAGDPSALESLAEAGSAIGTGFAVLVNLFNPEKIVLGGPVSVAGEFLMPSIRESVSKHAMQEILAQTEINLSAFGPDASLVGAAAVVVDDVLTYPSHIEKEVMPDTIPAQIVEYH